MPWLLLVIPLMGGLIGWITNVIALRLLFWPEKPFSCLGLTFHGAIPKRKAAIARNLGRVVGEELLTADKISANWHPDKQKLGELLSTPVASHVEKRLPGFLPSYLKGRVGTLVSEMVCQGIITVWEETGDKVIRELSEEINIQEIVETRLSEMDMVKVRKLVLKVASKELRSIEVMGGVLGFIIGLVQIGFVLIARP